MNRRWMGSKRIKLVRLLEMVDCITKPAFECNICHRPIRHPFDSPRHESPVFKLHVAGGGFRPREQCPFCLANDRLRFTVEVLRKYTTLYTEKCDVLEFAPIPGFRKSLMDNGRCSYLSGDIVPGRADRVLDITKIDLPDESLDAVICCHVLEHIQDEAAAITEMRRILRPGGWMLLSMPVCPEMEATYEDPSIVSPEDRLRAYGQPDHVRLYGRDVVSRFGQYGLEVREIIAKDAMPELLERYGLIPDDCNYLCYKPTNA